MAEEEKIIGTVGDLIAELQKHPKSDLVYIMYQNCVMTDMTIVIKSSGMFNETYIKVATK